MTNTQRSPATVRAAGAVLWRPDVDGQPVLAVVHRPHHGDWSLPKGKVDPGESLATTAVRELAEETGFAAVLGRHIARVRYPVGGAQKVVDYWDARAGEGSFAANGETDELRWLDASAASALCSYASDRDVIEEFDASPFPLRTLLLVRHAKAGRRAEWRGSDDDRPLEDDGEAQAERVAALLACHGVTALHAVPKLRCRQTLEPAARRLGTTITPEPAFADDAVAADPGRARQRLREILASPATTAVCAQGDGIPELVRGLAAESPGGPTGVRSNRRLAAPPARKGSVWTLAFHRGDDGGWDLAAADYARDAAH